MSREKGPLGERLDALGVTAGLEPDDLVADAVVIMQVVEASGDVRVQVCWSDGLRWVARRGMIEAARDAEVTPPPRREDD
jgi:hypothetical protein